MSQTIWTRKEIGIAFGDDYAWLYLWAKWRSPDSLGDCLIYIPLGFHRKENSVFRHGPMRLNRNILGAPRGVID